jgi:hypothetical protein
MNPQRPLLDQVFILRFWKEAIDADEHARWRVLVRNINTRRRDVVDDVQGAFAIVAANLSAAAGEGGTLERLNDEPAGSEREAEHVQKHSNGQ